MLDRSATPLRRATDGRHRVLVVDEDPVERDAMVAQLSGFAHVDVAPSAEAALAQSELARPDLLVIDAALLDAVRAGPGLAGVPVVVLMPRAQTGFELRAIERGAIDAIAKPVAQSPLRTRVRAHLRVRSLSSELRAAASIDAQTGLANRRTFFRHLHEEHRRSVRERLPMHLLLVEIDELDALGTRSDEVLSRVATAVRQNVREDDVVARIDGARIAVLLHESTTRGAAIVARRLRDAVSALAIPHDTASSGVVTISVVIGHLAASIDGAHPVARLIDGTEHALAQSKNGERGQVWFYDVAS